MTARVLAALIAISASAAEPSELKPVQSWQGSARDESKAETVLKVITTADQLAEAWKSCERTDAVPTIDFAKHVGIILTTRGSRIIPRAKLSEDGNLQVLGMETRDIRPGFRYHIGIYSREGVKKVNDEVLR